MKQIVISFLNHCSCRRSLLSLLTDDEDDKKVICELDGKDIAVTFVPNDDVKNPVADNVVMAL